MTRKLQILRGTTSQNNSYTGSAGELTMDTTLNEVRIHDGSTAGGHTLAKKASIPTVNNATITVTQGGVTKGSFTTNQSSASTIALDAVNDSTITITQGGVTKGTFTTNQSSASTIALDAGGSINPGFIMSFAGSTVPAGWLACDGSAISRIAYADLFDAIGTTYGPGNGSTTFNLPDISDCFVQGGTPGTTHAAGLPNITGGIDISSAGYKAATLYPSGSLQSRGTEANVSTPQSAGRSTLAFGIKLDASMSSSIYGNSDTVQPKSVEMMFCIKY